MKLPARIDEGRALDIPRLERLERSKPKREHLPGLFLFSLRDGEGAKDHPKPRISHHAEQQPLDEELAARPDRAK